MAKMKLTLGALPNFKLPVDVIMANGDEAQMVLTVRHRKASELQDLYDAAEPPSDVELIKFLAVGWDLEDEFCDEKIAELLDLFPNAAIAVTGAYMKALAGVRVKS